MAVTPNTVRLVLTAQQENSQRISVYHYRTTSPHVWTGAELFNLAATWWSAVGPSLRNAANVNVTFVSVYALDLGVVPAQSWVYTISGSNLGTVTGESVPANCASVISWKTGYSGKSYRGRTYLFGLSESQTAASNLTASAVTLAGAVAIATTGYTNPSGIAVTQAVLSRTLNLSTPINAFTIDNLVDSQRRRLLNRGN